MPSIVPTWISTPLGGRSNTPGTSGAQNQERRQLNSGHCDCLRKIWTPLSLPCRAFIFRYAAALVWFDDSPLIGDLHFKIPHLVAYCASIVGHPSHLMLLTVRIILRGISFHVAFVK